MIRVLEEPGGENRREPGPRSLLLSLERAMAAKSDAPSARAQELYYDAMEAPTRSAALALLEKALELDPGNVDVLLVLFGHEKYSAGEGIEFLRELVKLAERRLGAEAFKEFAGMFWGFHETRPYMRVRHTLAEHLRAAGRLEEAVAEYEGMLALNPGDNQGVRYLLLPCLLTLQRLDAARQLFEKYPDELKYNVVFAWARVLERFLSDDLPGAGAALAMARKQNPHVQVYVKGHRQVPKTTPEAYAPGSKEEAICFADVVRTAWAKYPAALKNGWRRKR